MVAAEDVCLLLSNSGETSELEVLPHLTRRGTGRIAIVGRADSSLARGSDVVLEAGVDRGALEPGSHRQHRRGHGHRRRPGCGLDGATRHSRRIAFNHRRIPGKQLTLTAADLMVPASQLRSPRPPCPR